jgi:hypothetical protein
MTNVTAEVHNKNLKRFADELVAKHKDRLQKAFPGRLGPQISPMVPKPPHERLAFYTTITQPDDFPLLTDEFYVRKWRRGWLPPPVSPYWLNLLAIPWAFEFFRSDMMSLYKRMVQTASDQA